MAKKNGAIGGKLLGAGGGGFMLFFAPPKKHRAIQKALGNKMFVPFQFEFTGSQVVYFSHDKVL
jgi:D-glycero-alpha-D-manno-heptose-7-phosphate kinase